MAVVFTIGGVTKTIKEGSLNISHTANGRARASFAIESTDGSYRPALDAEVLITEGGTRIFGGLVDTPREQGLAKGKGVAAIVTQVDAVDFATYADRRFVNETIPAGTLKSFLVVFTTYLSAAGYGVTLDAGQVDGPTLPAATYDYHKLSDALNQLVTLTADGGEPYVWRIDAFKVLRMYQPTTTAAPFNLIGNTLTQVIGDVEVEQSRSTDYANSVIVKVPSKSEAGRTETFTGDGVTTAFTLQYTPNGWMRGLVNVNGVDETLTRPGDTATWIFDPGTNTITRTSAPAAAATISVVFDGVFTGQGLASDAGEIAAVGIWEKVVSVETVPSNTTAQAIAAAELARSLHVSQTAKYLTLETGLAVGQSQTITIPRRNIDLAGMISDISIREYHIAGNPTQLARSVTVVVDDSQTNIGRSWQDVIKSWSGDKSGGVAATTTVGAAPTKIAPAAPDTAVQFNTAGVFGGSAAFTWDKTTNCLIAGGGGSSITATNPESCQVFGYDCHITDP